MPRQPATTKNKNGIRIPPIYTTNLRQGNIHTRYIYDQGRRTYTLAAAPAGCQMAFGCDLLLGIAIYHDFSSFSIFHFHFLFTSRLFLYLS
ncbi:hypothetical protein CI102_14254 [Trichoderma harzianum]|uniref:Uncharacterized protein n=1 Tax=Trichoderma harzianum CBS 226.95 TaxID=983964 RepID=A0A2T4ARV4_TRIHA|nr:hypothetical protein M431DRAFT_314565 [Trichoderma harzianum CBS 226.95]PKK40828.1 hypothetical protein CI102_14254 [Trichoderma harzianum]PTB59773.1 hypothetical protein M431DRAFT_314565 [Trichoderma harzianum CBS 226.95]